MRKYLPVIVPSAIGVAMYAGGSRREWLLAMILVMGYGLALQVRRANDHVEVQP